MKTLRKRLKSIFLVHEISEPYENRGKSEYVRVYVEVSLK